MTGGEDRARASIAEARSSTGEEGGICGEETGDGDWCREEGVGELEGRACPKIAEAPVAVVARLVP